MKLICIFPFKTKSPFCIDSIFIVINKNYQLKQKQNKKTVDVKDNQTSESCTKVPHTRRVCKRVSSFGVLYAALTCFLRKRLFPGLEPVTFQSHDNNFSDCVKVTPQVIF